LAEPGDTRLDRRRPAEGERALGDLAQRRANPFATLRRLHHQGAHAGRLAARHDRALGPRERPASQRAAGIDAKPEGVGGLFHGMTIVTRGPSLPSRSTADTTTRSMRGASAASSTVAWPAGATEKRHVPP